MLACNTPARTQFTCLIVRVTILLSLIRLQYFFPFRTSGSSGIVKNDPCICMPMYDFHMIAYVLRYNYSRLERQHLRSVPHVCTYCIDCSFTNPIIHSCLTYGENVQCVYAAPFFLTAPHSYHNPIPYFVLWYGLVILCLANHLHHPYPNL